MQELFQLLLKPLWSTLLHGYRMHNTEVFPWWNEQYIQVKVQ